ncbi:hypothetical protein YC2023_077197 [Brassica napus]
MRQGYLQKQRGNETRVFLASHSHFATGNIVFECGILIGNKMRCEFKEYGYKSLLPLNEENIFENVPLVVSESVNGTNAGRKSLAEDKGPDVLAAVPADASS